MREQMAINAICAAVALGGLAAAGWTVITGQLSAQGLDALFLIVVGLTVAVLFGAVPLRTLRGRKSGGKKQSAGA
jgi:hypothetical protein